VIRGKVVDPQWLSYPGRLAIGGGVGMTQALLQFLQPANIENPFKQHSAILVKCRNFPIRYLAHNIPTSLCQLTRYAGLL
jgi:hypothetical protein